MTKKSESSVGHRQLDPSAVAEALRASGGIVSAAAQSLRCSRQTVYMHLKKHPEVKAAQEEGDEAITDMAEVKLIKKIKDENLKAIIFRLETKGRKRGYVKRQELAGAPDAPIKFVPDFSEK